MKFLSSLSKILIMAPNDDDHDDERNDLLTVLLPADGKKAHKGEEGRESFPRMEKGVRQTQYVNLL